MRNEKGLSLFCAHPCNGDTQEASRSLADICALHSHVTATRDSDRP